MPTNSYDLESKVTRAVRAQIIAAGADAPENVIAGPSIVNRTLPNTTIYIPESDSASAREEIMGSGNMKFPAIGINFRDNAVNAPGDSNPRGSYLAANARISATIQALTQTDDEGASLNYTRSAINSAAQALAVDSSMGANAVQSQDAFNNADMADFSFIWWQIVDYGTMKMNKDSGGGTFWERTIFFEGIACNSAIGN